MLHRGTLINKLRLSVTEEGVKNEDLFYLFHIPDLQECLLDRYLAEQPTIEQLLDKVFTLTREPYSLDYRAVEINPLVLKKLIENTYFHTRCWATELERLIKYIRHNKSLLNHLFSLFGKNGINDSNCNAILSDFQIKHMLDYIADLDTANVNRLLNCALDDEQFRIVMVNHSDKASEDHLINFLTMDPSYRDIYVVLENIPDSQVIWEYTGKHKRYLLSNELAEIAVNTGNLVNYLKLNPIVNSVFDFLKEKKTSLAAWEYIKPRITSKKDHLLALKKLLEPTGFMLADELKIIQFPQNMYRLQDHIEIAGQAIYDDIVKNMFGCLTREETTKDVIILLLYINDHKFINKIINQPDLAIWPPYIETCFNRALIYDCFSPNVKKAHLAINLRMIDRVVESGDIASMEAVFNDFAERAKLWWRRKFFREYRKRIEKILQKLSAVGLADLQDKTVRNIIKNLPEKFQKPFFPKKMSQKSMAKILVNM